MSPTGVVFEAQTPIGPKVRVTRGRWELIVGMKHPIMAGREAEVRAALEDPTEVRRSRTDEAVLLFYKAQGIKRWTCAVVKTMGRNAFLVTAYPTDAIKEGSCIWPI